MNPLSLPLTLPCGAVLQNRIGKGAMTEGLADSNDNATKRHDTLYGTWSDGGAGMLLTGNVMVDRRYLERPYDEGMRLGVSPPPPGSPIGDTLAGCSFGD